MPENETAKSVSRREFLTLSPLSTRERGKKTNREGSRTRIPRGNRYLERLNELGVSIVPISENDTKLKIRCSDADTFSDEQISLLLPFAERISQLNLGGTDVSDEGLVVLDQLNQLKKLYLQQTNVTDEGLSEVSRAQSLEYLNLFDTDISDEGLMRLTSLERLEQLYIWRTNVTEQGIQELQDVMPDLNVHQGI